MSLNGLVFGLLFGFVFFGPLGAIIGAFTGFLIENSLRRFLGQGPQAGDNFLVPLFSLFAKAAQESGGPTSRQLQFINLLFRTQFFLGWRSQEIAIRAFEEALEDDKSIEDWIQIVSGFPLDGFRKHWLIQTVAQILVMNQGTLNRRGQEILNTLSQAMGYHYSFQGSAGSQGSYRPRSTPQFSDPREVLGLSRSAGASDIKKQYRQLVKEFHPDHFQNLPEDDPKRQEAQEKFIKIQNAYDQLKTEMAF